MRQSPTRPHAVGIPAIAELVVVAIGDQHDTVEIEEVCDGFLDPTEVRGHLYCREIDICVSGLCLSVSSVIHYNYM